MNLVPGAKTSFSGEQKGLFSGEQTGDIDAWEIRYQLKEIKSMMSQIRN